MEKRDAEGPGKLLKLFLAITATAIVALGCFGSDPENISANPIQVAEGGANLLPTAIPTNTPTPIPQAVVGSHEDARNLIWVYLSQCISFDVEQLQAELVQDDWYVKAASGSSQGYGIWRVNAVTGNLDTHDHAARQWKSYINSECDPEVPIAISTPAPTPVLTDSAQAVATLWTYLAKCYSDLPVADLEATWDPGKDEWVVITGPGAETDYGVWRVQRDAMISPDNFEARNRNEEVRAESCTLVVTSTDDAVATMASYLAKCFFGLNPGDLVAEYDEDESTWTVFTKASAETKYGRWLVRRDAKLFPLNSVARIRDEEVRSELCTLGILSGDDAIRTVWTHLVECSPTLQIADLMATLDPSNDEYVVITIPDRIPPDHGVWRVQRDATLTPVNQLAETRDSAIKGGNC